MPHQGRRKSTKIKVRLILLPIIMENWLISELADGIDHMYQILLSLRWPNPDVIKNRLMENKDKFLSAAMEWIFQDTERFLNWQNNLNTSLLWIKGGAGKGKTMMAIGITERLLSASDNSVLVTFFSCQNADSQLNTIAAILEGLILRLLYQNHGLEDILLNRWDRKTYCRVEKAEDESGTLSHLAIFISISPKTSRRRCAMTLFIKFKLCFACTPGIPTAMSGGHHVRHTFPCDGRTTRLSG
jgi:hypothetical protein